MMQLLLLLRPFRGYQGRSGGCQDQVRAVAPETRPLSQTGLVEDSFQSLCASGAMLALVQLETNGPW
jgi:hypothetical protein